jgi:hypothetical protein
MKALVHAYSLNSELAYGLNSEPFMNEKQNMYRHFDWAFEKHITL